jgi:hypothetical protein
MSLFTAIVSKLFGHSSAQAATPTAPAGASGAAPTSPTPHSPADALTKAAAAATAPAATPASPAATPAAPAATPAASAAAIQGVDVTAILDGLVAKHQEKLDWRHSIVDLLKALDLDSSLASRKELAKELHYEGSTDDSATMNVWLIKQVIAKLAANGGKVPAELLH